MTDDIPLLVCAKLRFVAISIPTPMPTTKTVFRTVPSGVNFMEKTITVRRTSITFSLWDLGGQREFVNMLPLVCNDAVAILFMFDLSRKSTLNSVKEWYRQARGFNKVSVILSIISRLNVWRRACLNLALLRKGVVNIDVRLFARICFIARPCMLPGCVC